MHSQVNVTAKRAADAFAIEITGTCMTPGKRTASEATECADVCAIERAPHTGANVADNVGERSSGMTQFAAMCLR